MAGSDVVEAMRLALKPFNIQHLADDWNANRTYLQLSVQRCQHPLAAERLALAEVMVTNKRVEMSE